MRRQQNRATKSTKGDGETSLWLAEKYVEQDQEEVGRFANRQRMTY